LATSATVEKLVGRMAGDEAALVALFRQSAQGERTRRGPVRFLQLVREAFSPQRSQIWLHTRILYEHMFAYNANMHLWLLRPRFDVLARDAHPWTPPWDKTMGVLVRAKTEAEAHELAQTKAGNEGLGIYRKFGIDEDEVATSVWLTPELTTCDELTAAGAPGVILVVRHED
jgi:hypothetical protein